MRVSLNGDGGFHPESLHSGKDRLCAQLLFDAEQLIVFADAVRTAGGASLDLAGVQATARSAIKVSSVSPDRWDMTQV